MNGGASIPYVSFDDLERSYCANVEEIRGAVYDDTPPQTEEEIEWYKSMQEYFDSL